MHRIEDLDLRETIYYKSRSVSGQVGQDGKIRIALSQVSMQTVVLSQKNLSRSIVVEGN